MKKIVFLDRDGTLNYDLDYVYKIEDYYLLDGVIEGLQKLIANDFNIVILSSQSGIGRGLYGKSEYEKFTKYMLEDLSAHNIEISGVYYCPHHAEHGLDEYKKICNCRKPRPGLIYKAEKELGPFDYSHSWAVGDKVRDLAMAKNANEKINTIILPRNYSTQEAEPIIKTKFADWQADNFFQAVNIILNNN